MTVAVKYLTYGAADFSFAPYGPYWKFMKKLCMSELLGGRTLDTLLPVRQDEISHLLRVLLRKANACEAVDVGGQLVMLTNNIISRMLMSQTCSGSDDEADEVKKLVKDVAELTGKFNLADYVWFCRNLDLQGMGKSLKKVRDKFDVLMEKIIKDHEETRKINRDHEVKDLVHILLDIAEDESSDIRLTRENIKAFILDIFVAGTDTSAITIEWALAELINNPDIMKKARDEIDSTIGTTPRLVQESDIPNLPCLQAVVKETLRLHPTGPIIVREATKDCTVADYHIPVKTQLFVNVWAIGRDPNHWEKPLEFRPERFLDGKGSLDVRGQHFHLLPFGSGRRGCPGTSLALQVIQTSLAAMIQCFEWRVDNGNVNMEEGPGLTLPRAHPLICVPVPRLNIPSF
jgi:cytochrome P450